MIQFIFGFMIGSVFGRASCDKHDLITDFIDMKKFETLKCVEEEGEQDG